MSDQQNTFVVTMRNPDGGLIRYTVAADKYEFQTEGVLFSKHIANGKYASFAFFSLPDLHSIIDGAMQDEVSLLTSQ